MTRWQVGGKSKFWLMRKQLVNCDSMNQHQHKLHMLRRQLKKHAWIYCGASCRGNWTFFFWVHACCRAKDLITMRKWEKPLLIACWPLLSGILLWTLCRCTYQASEQLHEPRPKEWKQPVLAWKLDSLGPYTQIPTTSNPSPAFHPKRLK